MEEKRIFLKSLINVYKNNSLMEKLTVEKRIIILNILKQNGLIIDYPRVKTLETIKYLNESEKNVTQIQKRENYLMGSFSDSDLNKQLYINDNLKVKI